MKNCPNCNEEVEEHFDLCWNCSYSFSENEVVELNDVPERKLLIDCLRCKVKMKYSGVYKFHEGARTGILGSAFEIFQNREVFDLYLCPKCGKVEFFSPRE